jgi:predicted transcriptional regulator
MFQVTTVQLKAMTDSALDRFSSRARSPRTWIAALSLAAIVGAAQAADANDEAATLAGAETRRVQAVVDGMRQALSVTHEVSVELVAANPRKASVAPVKGAPGRFRLSLERPFLEQLTHVELKAVIAHELGHVWIYTHHPYLHTEQLANQIALRAVSRDSLDSMYGKVWPDAAERGALPRFPDARAPELSASDPD